MVHRATESDYCATETVELQENGIIRNRQGEIIGRLKKTEKKKDRKNSTKPKHISEAVIKEALAEYFNNHDANYELVGKDFSIYVDDGGDDERKFYAKRIETGYEVKERGGCPECHADKKHIDEFEDEVEGAGILLIKHCKMCLTRWQYTGE